MFPKFLGLVLRASLVEVMDTQARLWMWLGWTICQVSFKRTNQLSSSSWRILINTSGDGNNVQQEGDGFISLCVWRWKELNLQFPIFYCARQLSWPSPVYVFHIRLEVLFFNWRLQGKVLDVSRWLRMGEVTIPNHGASFMLAEYKNCWMPLLTAGTWIGW